MGPHRRRTAAIVLAVVALATTGCAPEPDPDPTPTGFATEDEAFAAAEETYRAYIDATNNVSLDDPTTFEKTLSFTTGNAQKNDQSSFDTMRNSQIKIDGSSQILSISRIEANSIDNAWQVAIQACVDVSHVLLTYPDGTSAISDERPDVQNVRIALSSASSAPNNLLIYDFSTGEKVAECD